MGGKRDNKEWDVNWEHPFPRVSGYKRRGDIKKVDIAFRVSLELHPPPQTKKRQKDKKENP